MARGRAGRQARGDGGPIDGGPCPSCGAASDSAGSSYAPRPPAPGTPCRSPAPDRSAARVDAACRWRGTDPCRKCKRAAIRRPRGRPCRWCASVPRPRAAGPGAAGPWRPAAAGAGPSARRAPAAAAAPPAPPPAAGRFAHRNCSYVPQSGSAGFPGPRRSRPAPRPNRSGPADALRGPVPARTGTAS